MSETATPTSESYTATLEKIYSQMEERWTASDTATEVDWDTRIRQAREDLASVRVLADGVSRGIGSLEGATMTVLSYLSTTYGKVVKNCPESHAAELLPLATQVRDAAEAAVRDALGGELRPMYSVPKKPQPWM
ncbi:MAG: hypothetical protein J2O48_01805 [Solirubrobacterales bacterium]|nr:hypothetical protein [Solirubrobacterales bacterium]